MVAYKYENLTSNDQTQTFIEYSYTANEYLFLVLNITTKKGGKNLLFNSRICLFIYLIRFTCPTIIFLSSDAVVLKVIFHVYVPS